MNAAGPPNPEIPDDERERGLLREGGAAALAAFLVLAVLHLSTAAPGAWWGDGLEFACAAHVLGVPHPPGYPLYTMLGAVWTRAFGLAGIEPGRALAILSALCCASAASGIGLLTGRLARGVGTVSASCDSRETLAPAAPEPAPESVSGPLVFGVALAVGVSRTVWDHATFAEVYPLALLFALGTTALCAATLGGSPRLGSLGALYGLALAHHYSLLALAPLVATATWIGAAHPAAPGRPRVRALVRFALPFALAQVAWLYLPLRAMAGPALNWGDPSNLERFLWMIGGGDYGRLPPPPGAPAGVAKIVAGLARWLAWWGGEWAPALGSPGTPFVPPSLAVGIGVGAVALLAGRLARDFVRLRDGDGAGEAGEREPGDRTLHRMIPGALLAILFGAAVAVGYPIPDLEGYFLPAMPMLAVVVAGWVRGARRPDDGAPGSESSSDRSIRAVRAIRATRMAGCLVVLAGALAFANVSALDKSWDDGPSRWAERALGALPRNAVLVTRQGVDTEILSLWHAQRVRAIRPDVAAIGSGFVFQGWYARQLRAEEAEAARALPPGEAPPSVPWGIEARPIGRKADFDAAFHAGIVVPALERGRRVFTTWIDAELIDRMNPRPFASGLLGTATLGPEEYRRRCAYRFALPSPTLFELVPDPRGFDRERAEFRERFGREPPASPATP